MTNLSIQFEYDDMYAEQDALLEEFCENPYDDEEEPNEPFFTSLNPWDAPGMSIKDFL